MAQYRVTADVFNARRPGVNSAIEMRKGQILSTEILAGYTDEQLAAHIAAGRIEEVGVAPENKKAPEAQKKGGKKGEVNAE